MAGIHGPANVEAAFGAPREEVLQFVQSRKRPFGYRVNLYMNGAGRLFDRPRIGAQVVEGQAGKGICTDKTAALQNPTVGTAPFQGAVYRD